MPIIPLPNGLVGSEHLPRTRQVLTNCFNNQTGQVISRPGVTELNDTGLVARGQFFWNDSLYQVVSQSLIKITDLATGAFSTIGTINGNAVIDTAIGFNTAVILVKGGEIYTLDNTDTLVTISGNANFVPSVAVAHIDGRFVYIPSDGDPAFFSNVGAAGTVEALSFFDAEELPDKNSTVFNFRNTLYIGGTDSLELFRDTGASPNPFTRLNGARISNGFIGGLIEYNETFLFIGREKDQGFGIYAINAGIAQKISNTFIDTILANYTEGQLGDAVGARIKWRGYDLATFTLANDSFGFLGGNWFKLETFDNLGIPGPWAGGFITQIGGVYYSASGSKIGRFGAFNQDYGSRISRVIELGFDSPENQYFNAQKLQIGLGQGFTSAGGTVGLAMSRNNVLYGDAFYRDLGAIGEYTAKLEWNYPGGLGAYDGFMGIRIITTQDVSFSVDGLKLTMR